MSTKGSITNVDAQVEHHNTQDKEALNDTIHHPKGWLCWQVVFYSESSQTSLAQSRRLTMPSDRRWSLYGSLRLRQHLRCPPDAAPALHHQVPRPSAHLHRTSSLNRATQCMLIVVNSGQKPQLDGPRSARRRCHWNFYRASHALEVWP